MRITEKQVRLISKNRNPKQNLVDSMIVVAERYPAYEFAQVSAQVMHESGGLRHDREIWGPTDAQERYEGRKDLGNTQPGDGSKFRGYGPLQVTGRYNVTEFRDWCIREGLNPPDFVKHPELIATAPWAGWSVIWYWEDRDLGKYAKQNDIEMITKRVNGGLNGYSDRLDYYTRTALVLLEYGPKDIKSFQIDEGLETDGISGPKTRAALHRALVKLDKAKGTVSAPVTASPSLEKPWYKTKEVVAPVATAGITTVAESFTDIPWQNLAVVAFVGLAAYLIWSRRREQKQAGLVK